MYKEETWKERREEINEEDWGFYKESMVMKEGEEEEEDQNLTTSEGSEKGKRNQKNE